MERFQVGDRVRCIKENQTRKSNPNAVSWLGREGIIVSLRAGGHYITVRFEEGQCPTCGHKHRDYVYFRPEELNIVQENASCESQHLKRRLHDLLDEAAEVERRISEADENIS